MHSAEVNLGSIKDERGGGWELNGGSWKIIWCCLRQSTSKSTREAALLTRVWGSSMTDARLEGEKLMGCKHGQVQGFLTPDWGKYMYNEQAYLRSCLFNTFTASCFGQHEQKTWRRSPTCVRSSGECSTSDGRTQLASQRTAQVGEPFPT